MTEEKPSRKSLNRLTLLFLRPTTTSPFLKDQPSPQSTVSAHSESGGQVDKTYNLKKLGSKVAKQMYDNNPFRAQPRPPNLAIPPLPPNYQAPARAPAQAVYHGQRQQQEQQQQQQQPAQGPNPLLQIPVPSRPAQHRQRSASSSNVPTSNNLFVHPPAAPIPRHSANKSHSDLTQLFNLNGGQASGARHVSLPDQSGAQPAGSRSNPLVNPPPPTVPNTVVEPAYNFVTPDGLPLTAATQKKKKGLFSSSKTPKTNFKAVGPAAWIAGHTEKAPYDLALLASGVKVPELWSERGDLLVYLFPPEARRGPSFRVNSTILASSAPLLASVTKSNVAGAGNGHQSQRFSELHIPTELENPTANPLSPADIQKLVRVRNMFAFLVGQSLIATPSYPTVFEIFVRIAALLENYGFTDGADATSFGQVADASFNMYISELDMLDMRNDCEKTIEGLLLGERMKSSTLWNEAFTHGVGQYSEIQQQCPEKFAALSQLAIQRLERARMDLEKRLLRIQDRLSDFDFPSVFSGLLNSRTAEVREVTRFEAWKSAFLATRKFLLSHLKQQWGSWPPKKSNKNSSVPALNRMVLKDMGYSLAMLYDLMVDRKHPSSRLKVYGKQFPAHHDRRIEALRRVLQEYDYSGSPVYPTVPFDAPLLPCFSENDDDNSDSEKKAKKVGKNELQFVLVNSYNKDTYGANLPFVQKWHAFEQKSTASMPIDRVVDFRLGAWLFIYCVLQALPMVTVDAPGVKFSDQVEYFLCEPPRGRLHWSTESLQYEWFRDPVTGNITQMAKDVIELSDEAIYQMSHCWKMGEIWEQELTILPSAKTATPPSGPVESASGRHQSLPAARSSPHQRVASRGSNPASAHHSPALHPNQFSPPMLQHPSWASSSPGIPQSSSFQSIPSLEYIDPAAAGLNPSVPSLLSIPTPPPAIEDPAGVGSNSRRYSGSRSRNSSPYAHGVSTGKRESVLMMGLERVPVPIHGGSPSGSPNIPSEGESLSPHQNKQAARVASMTFEDILASTEDDAAPKKQRGRALNRTLLGGGTS